MSASVAAIAMGLILIPFPPPGAPFYRGPLGGRRAPPSVSPGRLLRSRVKAMRELSHGRTECLDVRLTSHKHVDGRRRTIPPARLVSRFLSEQDAGGDVPETKAHTDEAPTLERNGQQRVRRSAQESRHDRSHARERPEHVDLEVAHPLRAPLEE